MIVSRRRLFGLCTGILAMAGALGSAEAAWPEKPIRFINPYSAGGGSDTAARLIAPELSKRLGQPVVVENITGAAGMIATETLTRSEPDGHTILIDAVGISQNPSLFQTKYDPFKDIAPVAKLVNLPFVLVVNPEVKATTPKELIELAKAQPGKIRAAAPGNSTRLAAEVFRLQTGITFSFVPYRGGAMANTGLLSGESHLIFSDLPSVAQYIHSGQMRALGMSSRERWPTMPDIPTIIEGGVPDYEVMTWYAVFAPGGTPRPILERLNKELVEIVNLPEMVEAFAKVGAIPAKENVDEFTSFFHAELKRWRSVIEQAGIKAQ